MSRKVPQGETRLQIRQGDKMGTGECKETMRSERCGHGGRVQAQMGIRVGKCKVLSQS